MLVDISEGLAKGKAMDLQEAMPIMRHPVQISGTKDFADTADSNVVIITAGQPRKPGMSRDDLLNSNAEVVRDTIEKTLVYSPEAIFIILTNPVDALTYLAFKSSGLPKNRVLGQAGILDSARFRILLSQELGVSVESVHAYVLGGHGDSMVPCCAMRMWPEFPCWICFLWSASWSWLSARAPAVLKSSASSKPEAPPSRPVRRWRKWSRQF